MALGRDQPRICIGERPAEKVIGDQISLAHLKGRPTVIGNRGELKEDRGKKKKTEDKSETEVMHQVSLIVGKMLGSRPLCLCVYLPRENLQKSQNGGTDAPKGKPVMKNQCRCQG